MITVKLSEPIIDGNRRVAELRLDPARFVWPAIDIGDGDIAVDGGAVAQRFAIAAGIAPSLVYKLLAVDFFAALLVLRDASTALAAAAAKQPRGRKS